MAPASIHGVMVALITPFTSDQKSIDLNALDVHIKRLLDAGVHGLVPGGSTGEFTVLSIEERKQLVEQTIKSVAGRVPVIAGVGELATSRAIDLAVHAAQVGAAALMVVPPFYDALSLEELKEMLHEIHQASQLPIMFYNIPSASGLTLSPEALESLADSGVSYMKDTSGNAPALTEMLFHRNTKITTFNGWDTLTFYGLAAGGKGCVWGAANVIPELCMELWDAVAVKGDLKRGRELWNTIWPVCALLEEGNYAGAVKSGMQIRGWETGGMRKPFGLLQGERKARLEACLQASQVVLRN